MFKIETEVVEEPHIRETVGTPLILYQLGEDVNFIADFDPVIHYAVENDLICGTAIRAGIDQIIAGFTHRIWICRHTGRHTQLLFSNKSWLPSS